MENLPKDPTSLLLLNKELTPKDFLNLCVSQSNENVKKLCKSDELFKQRFSIDFPSLVLYYQVLKQEMEKEEYLKVVKILSEATELMIDKLIDFQLGKNFKKNLSKEFLGITF